MGKNRDKRYFDILLARFAFALPTSRNLDEVEKKGSR